MLLVYAIRVLYGWCATRVLHGWDTSKIEFRVAVKPDDELYKFQTDGKLALVTRQLSMLLLFRKGRRVDF